MRKYRRRLPHIDVPGAPTFVTWRLWGSLPAERTCDRLLDEARSGPVYLRQPEIARLVAERLRGTAELHANRLLGRSGSFWQAEYFDRVVRNDREFESIRAYIEYNPVKAGLVRSPEEFVWSSAWRG